MAFLRWRQGFKGILEAHSLEELNVVNYPFQNLIPLSNLTRLRRLKITSRKLASLDGITKLQQLEHLDLYNCPNLSSLSGVEECPQKIEIEVETCRHISRDLLKTHNETLEPTP